jgi:hypothetical protein
MADLKTALQVFAEAERLSGEMQKLTSPRYGAMDNLMHDEPQKLTNPEYGAMTTLSLTGILDEKERREKEQAIQAHLEAMRRFDAEKQEQLQVEPLHNQRFDELETQAEYGVLPDFLGLDEIAFLMGKTSAFVSFLQRTDSGLNVEVRRAERWYGLDEMRLSSVGALSTQGVTKAEFKRWLQSVNRWPVSGLLANWWRDELQTDEVVPLADTGAVDGVESKYTGIKPNSNELDFSGLLKEPAKKDDWFEVIDEMTKDYFSKNRTMPSRAKAWAALYTSPPDGYSITTDEDKNDSYLKMPSAKRLLSRTNFYERWESYTAE